MSRPHPAPISGKPRSGPYLTCTPLPHESHQRNPDPRLPEPLPGSSFPRLPAPQIPRDTFSLLPTRPASGFPSHCRRPGQQPSALKPFSSGPGSLVHLLPLELTDFCHCKGTDGSEALLSQGFCAACLPGTVGAYQLPGTWIKGWVEGFDKAGQPGAGCQFQHIPTGHRGCASCTVFAGPFQRSVTAM